MKKHESGLSKLLTISFAILLVCVLCTRVFGAGCVNLRFAQISDVHYSDFEEDTSYKVLKSSGAIFDDVIMQVNCTPNVDFVMFTGDMINKPKSNQLVKFISHANLLERPWYFVFGNHDTSLDGITFTKSLYLDIVNGHNKNFCYKTPYYSFCPKKGYKVIALDTIEYSINPQGRVSEEQLQWLKDELDNSKGDVVLIFTHVPVMEPFASDNHRLVNSYELKILLKKYDMPIIICSGHYHGTKIIQEDNILYINTPSLVSFPNAFRIVNISPQRSKVIVDVYLKETRLKEIQAKAKAKVMGSMLLYGREEDRTATFELPKKRDRNSI
ncbi:MAG: metallophosphoesterase [Candidatus Gastranaerophilales bacterium]|nr:metallophosphoesterase [Candidatus Gastranaerophilales bacterium]